MRAPRRVAAALALLVLLVAAGCGGGGEDRTSGLTAREILQAARGQAAALTSYRAEIRASVSVDAAPGALPPPARALVGRPLELTAQAAVRRPDALSLDFAVAGLPFQGNVTKIGGRLYLSVLGNDLQLSTPPEQLALIRPAELAPAMVSWVADPQEVGRERIDGDETVHLRGGLDAGVVVTDVAGLLRQVPGLVGEAPSAAEVAAARRRIRSALRSGSAEVWVGVSDLRMRRVRVAVTLRGPLPVLPGLREASLELVADLSRFDEPVEVSAPANPRPVTPDELLALLGVG